jgi:hypothetical protein
LKERKEGSIGIKLLTQQIGQIGQHTFQVVYPISPFPQKQLAV